MLNQEQHRARGDYPQSLNGEKIAVKRKKSFLND